MNSKTMSYRESVIISDLIRMKMNDQKITKTEGQRLLNKVKKQDLSVWDSVHDIYEERE